MANGQCIQMIEEKGEKKCYARISIVASFQLYYLLVWLHLTMQFFLSSVFHSIAHSLVRMVPIAQRYELCSYVSIKK